MTDSESKTVAPAFCATVLTESIERAAQFIRQGEVVAFPTETVYGLGADVFNESAIQKIFQAKGRPTDNPLIAHVAELAQIQSLVAHVPPQAAQLIEAFFPAPLTLVLPKHERVPLLATAGLGTIGVRMPQHALARRFIAACGTPLVAPSANLSGKPSPTTWQAVQADLAGRIACILQGAQTLVGLESTVVDCTTDTPVILRAGAVTLEQLQSVIPAARLASQHETAIAKSPGMKYRHYSPRARVLLVEPDAPLPAAAQAAYLGLHPPATSCRLTRQCADLDEYAHVVFDFFRACDAQGISLIYCEKVAPTGLGLALMDRLQRAATA